MANISTFLQAIMSARYGKDVRQSIHDGIKAINDEVAADKNEVIASKEAAENAATAASTSAQEASASESAAKKSETAAAASESAVSTSAQEASASESAAKKSETAAAASESAASTSAQEASASESAAKKSENAAAASESAAATSAQKASASESAAKKSETAAAASKSAASTSAQTAIDKATLAKSYAVGGTGTRAGEDTDNAKYYMTQAEKQTGGIPTKLSQLENDAGFIAEDGDGSGLTVGFTEAAARENIASGENTGTLMGKIKKWLADLAAAAFMQVITSYADLMAGTALDNYLIGAAAAKEGFTELNGKLIAPDYKSAVAIQSNYTCMTNGYVIGTIQGAVNGWASIRSSKNANYFLALCTSSENPIAVCIPFASGDSVIFGSSGTYNLAFASAK